MYLYCIGNSKTKHQKCYLLNLKNNQFYDISLRKKVVLEEIEREDLHILSSYTFVQDSELLHIFSEKGFYAICDSLENKNYINSPLNIISYKIRNAMKDTFSINDINLSSLSISFRVRSLDDRIDQNIDYLNLKFRNSI